MSIASLLTSDTDANLNILSKSDRMHHDWNAIRTIREGYASTWSLLMTYFTWFNITTLGAVTFVIKGGLDRHLLIAITLIGTIVLFLQIIVFFYLRKFPQMTRERIDRIIEAGKAVDSTIISGNMIITRSGDFVINVMIIVMIIDTLGWIYMSYFMLRSEHTLLVS